MPWASQMRKIHPELLAGIVRHLERFGAIDHTKRSRLAEAKRLARMLIDLGKRPNHPRALIAYLAGELHTNAIRERSRRECKRPLLDYELAERARARKEDRYLEAAIKRLRARFG